MFSNPIWVENYENYVSTSSLEGVCGPLEQLGGLQNMGELFCGIEGKVWELWEFLVKNIDYFA